MLEISVCRENSNLVGERTIKGGKGLTAVPNGDRGDRDYSQGDYDGFKCEYMELSRQLGPRKELEADKDP